MRIGILGGTFDPPHLGHLIAVVQMKERLGFDEVWLMPVASHAFGKKLTSSRHRLAMTKLLERTGIIASDFEIELGGISSTYHTMRALKQSFPTHSFTFCIGSDLIADFQKWDNWKELLLENPLAIYPRGYESADIISHAEMVMGKGLMSQIAVIQGEDVVVTNISSTIIRKRIQEGYLVDHLVHPDVLKYITQFKLYQ